MKDEITLRDLLKVVPCNNDIKLVVYNINGVIILDTAFKLNCNETIEDIVFVPYFGTHGDILYSVVEEVYAERMPASHISEHIFVKCFADDHHVMDDKRYIK